MTELSVAAVAFCIRLCSVSVAPRRTGFGAMEKFGTRSTWETAPVFTTV